MFSMPALPCPAPIRLPMRLIGGRKQIRLPPRASLLMKVSLHRLLEPLHLVTVPADDQEHRDIGTWADLRDLADESPHRDSPDRVAPLPPCSGPSRQ